VADTSPERGRWALRPVPPEPRSIVELIGAGTVDAELAATVWVLVEGRVPVIVASPGQGTGRSTFLDALLDLVPARCRVIELRGAEETFDWLPQASELGWPGVGRPPAHGTPVRPENAILVADDLVDAAPAVTSGKVARIAVRAATIGYGLAATIEGDSLDEVFDRLRAAPVELTDDELSRLGVVLVLRRVDGQRRRVVAAHYVRPVVRDIHGHVQRLGPAVLATWNDASDTFEQFGWGITPELAVRTGRRAGDFELEVGERRRFLEGLVHDGVTEVAAARAAIAGYRSTIDDSASAPGASPQSHVHAPH
jgi:hypothetical protein